jgi:hypothetical protein
LNYSNKKLIFGGVRVRQIDVSPGLPRCRTNARSSAAGVGMSCSGANPAISVAITTQTGRGSIWSLDTGRACRRSMTGVVIGANA